MKRFLAVLMGLFLFSGSSFAVGSGYGIREMGMGGTGIAIANDAISSAYFNPAGLAYGSLLDAQLFAGGNSQLITAAQNKHFLTDNFNTTMNIENAEAKVGFGVSFKNVGVSAFSIAQGSLMHTGGSTLIGDVNAQVIASTPITIATIFSAQGSNESTMAIGMNIKPIQIYGGSLNFLLGTAVQSQMTGSGLGFDVGMQAKMNPNVSLGLVIRNIATSYSFSRKTQTGTVNGFGSFTAVGAETTTDGNDTIAPEIGAGIGVNMPETGTLVAFDMENYSYADNGNMNKSLTANDLHLGVEQSVLSAVMLRVGYFTYTPTNDTFYTYGVALNIMPFDFGLASVNSQKDKNSSSTILQVGISL